MDDKTLLTRPDLFRARRWFVSACQASRAHADLASLALAAHGDHGPDVSGCVRQHFPEAVKKTLRDLAQNVTLYSDCARDARPKGVRHATIRALGAAVARRDGTGFYGPCP